MENKISDKISKHTTILVIDDIPSARRITLRLLNMLGFEKLLEAGSLEEARKVIGENYLGLIISDIHLRDGKGTDLFAHFKEIQRDIPTILITSDMEEGTFKEALKNGATTYLLKPFSSKHLVEKLEQALSNAK